MTRWIIFAAVILAVLAWGLVLQYILLNAVH